MSPELWCVDIETRPTEAYVWGLRDQNVGLNQIIKPGGLMMFVAQRRGAKTGEAHTEWDDYERMVRRAHEIYDAADYIVTYNGARFDNSHLRAVWAELGMTPPSPWRDIDLYRTARKFNWPSRKLAYVCEVLGLDHKTDPGGFDTWDEIIRGEGEVRDRARRRMVKYCRNDVKITLQLFEKLLPWIDGLNVPLYMEDVRENACTRCGSTELQSRGYAYATTYRYRRYQCQTCGGWMRHRKSEPIVNAELRNA